MIQGVYGNPNQVNIGGVNKYVALLEGGKMIQNQTRITTNDLYFSPTGGGATFATNGAFEYQVYDATVYRLREISLGYSLPKKWISKMKISAVTLSLSGRNLWFWAPNIPKYTNFDPDINSVVGGNNQGYDGGGAPSTKRYGINLNVTF